MTGLVNSSGTTIEAEYRYRPFGDTETATGTVTNNVRFAGRELDPESGLYYNRARYYDAKLGRFASEDPTRLAGGINPYVYAANDPINARDPGGTECWWAEMSHSVDTVYIQVEDGWIGCEVEDGSAHEFEDWARAWLDGVPVGLVGEAFGLGIPPGAMPGARTQGECPGPALTPGPGAGAPITSQYTFGPLTQADVDFMNDLPGYLIGVSVGALTNMIPALRGWRGWAVGAGSGAAMLGAPRQGYRPQVGDVVTFWYAARADPFFDNGIDPFSERRCITVERP